MEVLASTFWWARRAPRPSMTPARMLKTSAATPIRTHSAIGVADASRDGQGGQGGPCRAILRGMRPGVIVGATIGNARIARAAGAEIDHLDTTPYQFSQPMDLAEYLVPVHADIPEIDAILLDGFLEKVLPGLPLVDA